MSSGTVVIDAWFSLYPFPGFVETLKKRAEEFERAHPRYRVEVKTTYWQRLPEEVSEAAYQGHPPTLASYYSGAAQLARDTLDRAGRPLFTSVQRAIGGRTEILGEPVVLHDVVAPARAYYTFGGEVTSMPMTLSTMHMYANLTMLRRAGVTQVPRTWAEVDAACKAVANMAGAPPYGIAWANDGKFFQHVLAQQGAVFANGHNGRYGRVTTIDLAGPEMMAFVTWWQRLHREGYYLYTGRVEDWEPTFRAFAEQRVALRFSSSFDARYMVEAAAAAGFDIAVSPVPHNGDRPYVGNWIGGDSIWVADGLDEATRDGALAFTQYLNNPANAAEWHRVYGSSPVTNAAIARLADEGWFARYPHFQVAPYQLNSTAHRPTYQAVLGPYAHVQRALMRAVEDLLIHEADPAVRFAEVTAEGQRLVDEYNARCTGPGLRCPTCLHLDS